MFASPDGGRVIRYGPPGDERFIPVPAELVPGLEMLAANPGALANIANSPAGAMARRIAGRMAKGGGP